MRSDAHRPTDAARKTVKECVAAGITEAQVARLIGISEPTLRKHYREELDTGLADAVRRVAGALFTEAVGGSVDAQKFYLAKRGGLPWADKQRVELTGNDGGPVSIEHVTSVLVLPPVDED